MTKTRISFFALIAALVLASLACNQAGQIMTPEEATAVARGEPVDGSSQGGATSSGSGEGMFAVGQDVQFVGTGFLIPIMKNPGDRMAYSNAARGQTATVVGSQELDDGSIWYQIESSAGDGWVAAASLAAVEGEVAPAAEETGAENAEGEAAAPAGDTYEVGSTVYLTGTAFLLNLYDAPGSKTIRANQQRGEPVVVLEVTDVDGVAWYKIDAPTGEGWVPEENLTAEAP